MVGQARSPSVLTKSTFLVPRTSVDPWHFNWRASEASETLSGVTKGNRRYIYIYIYIYIYMVRARHFSSAGPVSRNVGGVNCKPFLKHSNYW